MKRVIFGMTLVLGTILTSCKTDKPSDSPESTIDSTAVQKPTEVSTVTVPSVDSAKVKGEENKPQEKKTEVK